MERLIRLIKSLKPHEVRFVQDYHVAARSKRRANLFNCIVNSKITSNREAIKQIYGDKPNAASALSHLKKKLWEDILNLLVILVPQPGGQSNPEKKILCEKYLLQSKILLAKGLHQEAQELLQRTIKLADQYHLPQINLSSYDLLLENRSASDLSNIQRRYQQSIDHYQDLVEAKSAYFAEHPLQYPSLESTSNGVCQRSLFWKSMNHIRGLCQQHDFCSAKQAALSLAADFQPQDLLYSRQKDALLQKTLSDICMQLQQYELSVSHAHQARQLLPGKCREFLGSSENMFLGYLRNHQLPEAQQLLVSLHWQQIDDPQQRNRWVLYQALLTFQQQHFHQVSQVLNQWRSKHCTDQAWTLAPRFLELLTILELRDYDWFEYRLECLRKKLGNCSKNLPRRVRMLYRLCHTLIHSQFDYRRLLEVEKVNLCKLNSDHPHYRWDPGGFELINIPQWVMSKCDLN